MPTFPVHRRNLAALLLLLLLAGLHRPPALAQEQPDGILVDRVVAVVNDQVITLSEVEEEGRDLFARILRDPKIGDLDRALDRARRQILSSLIDKTLVEQRARELGVTVTEEEVDMAVEQLAAANNMDKVNFEARLAAEGIDRQRYRKGLEWQVLQSKLVSYELRNRVVITEERARQYYEEQYATDRIPEGYHLLQIGLRWDPASGDAGRDRALAMARKLRQQIADGASFQEVARQYSQMASASRGGDIGAFRADEMAPAMRQAIVGLDAGQLSQPVVNDADHTVQFFFVLSIREGDVVQPPPFSAVREEITNRLRETEMERLFQDWVKELRETAYIDQLL